MCFSFSLSLLCLHFLNLYLVSSNLCEPATNKQQTITATTIPTTSSLLSSLLHYHTGFVCVCGTGTLCRYEGNMAHAGASHQGDAPIIYSRSWGHDLPWRSSWSRHSSQPSHSLQWEPYLCKQTHRTRSNSDFMNIIIISTMPAIRIMF